MWAYFNSTPIGFGNYNSDGWDQLFINSEGIRWRNILYYGWLQALETNI